MPRNAIEIMTVVIQKQILVLGPNVALTWARNVPGLTVDNNGVIVSFAGDEKEALRRLVDEFESISGAITRNLIQSLI